MTNPITIIGGGLSGSEAAWQLAKRGHAVTLYEMRPQVQTGAHATGHLAEVVCSNSLGSFIAEKATGLLQAELDILGSHLLECAKKTAVPAGGALAVDREEFSKLVTATLTEHPLITIKREEVQKIPDGPTIIASGPLTSPALSEELGKLTGENHLFFFDAISPIVTAESINRDIAFSASRHGKGQNPEGDYINCPLNKEEYQKFVEALIAADRILLKSFEEAINSGVKAGAHTFFEGCLPVEIIAGRGLLSLAFGPMRPVGLDDPKTGRRPYAVVQLRQDNIAGSLYNMVGFQTNLKFGEQEKVFRMIPGLEQAEFVRHGQMHRNTFLNAPRMLKPTLQFKNKDDLLFAGQITGVEGYMGNIATGLLAGINMAQILESKDPLILPKTTMLGALCHYITEADAKDFQPMKANFGILPPLCSNGTKIKKIERGGRYSERALSDLKGYLK